MVTTVANGLGLLGFAAIRFGARAGGIVLTLIGLAIVGALVWALTKPDKNAA
jgi:hypothetical protein